MCRCRVPPSPARAFFRRSHNGPASGSASRYFGPDKTLIRRHREDDPSSPIDNDLGTGYSTNGTTTPKCGPGQILINGVCINQIG